MVTIRQASIHDADVLFVLAEELTTSFTLDRRSFDASLAEAIRSAGACVLVACDRGGRVVGYCFGLEHPTFYANGRSAWVQELMVDQAWRRQGIGRMLMSGFEQWATSHNAKLIALATRRAGPFYRQLGYEESAAYFKKHL